MANEERMSYRQYAKFEKVFFLYGSCAKMVAPVRPNEWKALAEDMWAWAIVKVESLVTACTDGFLDTPPGLSASTQDEPEADMSSDVRVNGRNAHLKAKKITAKSVQTLKSGEKNGRKWTITKIVDTDSIPYTTFAGHRYAVGKEYLIEYEEIVNGEYVDYRIKESK
jgi:hypothetical protein